MTAIAMRMRTHKGITAVLQGIALLRRLGDRASVFVPGVASAVTTDLQLGTYFVPSGYDNTITFANGGFYTNVGTAGQTRACLTVACVVGQQYTLFFTNASAQAISIFVREGSDGYGSIVTSTTLPVGATSISWTATTANMVVLWNFNPPAAITITNVKLQTTRYAPFVQGASLTPTIGTQALGPNTATVTSATMTGAVGYTAITGAAAAIGALYYVSYSYNVTSGAAQANIGGVNCPSINGPASGSYSGFVTAISTTAPTMYSNGAVGAITNYSVSLVTTMPTAAWLMDYVESTMSTAAAIDGPVGALTDGVATVGAELLTNGTFNGLTSWNNNSTGTGTVSAVNNEAILTTVDGSNRGVLSSTPIATTVGAAYLITFTVRIVSGTNGANITFGNVAQNFGAGKWQVTALALSASTGLQWLVQNNSGSVAVSSVSVKPITGRHATQGTGANKPTLRGGLLNLLLNNKDPSQSGWGVLNASYALGQQDSAGGTSAFKIVDNVTSGQHHVYSTYASSVNLTPYTFAAVVKAGEHPAVLLDMSDLTLGDVYCAFNLTAGAVMGQGANPWTANAASIAPLGGGWYLCAISATRNSTGTSIRGFVRLNNGTTDVFAGNGSSGIYCDGIGMFRGALTAQQIIALGGIPRTTTAAASGKVGNSRLEFVNGGTQSLALQSAPFSVSDDHVVIQGVTAQDTSGTHASFAMANGNSRFPVLYVSAGGYPAVSWRDDTGVGVTVTAGQVSNGDSFVFTGRKVGSLGYARKNGIPYQVAITGLGTTTATAAFIGASTAGTINWVGDIYPTVIVKGSISDAELLVLERFVGALTGPTGVRF